jgi:hypothetical protein
VEIFLRFQKTQLSKRYIEISTFSVQQDIEQRVTQILNVAYDIAEIQGCYANLYYILADIYIYIDEYILSYNVRLLEMHMHTQILRDANRYEISYHYQIITLFNTTIPTQMLSYAPVIRNTQRLKLHQPLM